MRRLLLGALAGVALCAAVAAPSASAYVLRMCGVTYAPACDTCVDDVCVPFNVE